MKNYHIKKNQRKRKFNIIPNSHLGPIISVDPKIQKYIMKCPICHYITIKTNNYDKHVNIHLKNKNDSSISKNIFKTTQNSSENDSNSKVNNISLKDSKLETLFKLKEQTYSNKQFFLLQKIFDETAHLSLQEVDIGNFLIYDKHDIDSGSFGTIFLGCEKETKIKVAIKRIKKTNYDSYLSEKIILTNIRGTGNYPEYYDSLELNDAYYIIEGLMGPSIDLLLSICGGKFDMFTTINIGIDVISNLKILHNQGYIHRDLKPSNLAFGSLSKGNSKDKLNIGILDFGSSTSIIKQQKDIKLKRKKICYRYGKRIFSSNNVLDNKPCTKIDDVISVFYILIRLFTGTLPWIEYTNEENFIDNEKVKKIRAKYPNDILCKDFPIAFRKEFDKLFNSSQFDEPDYFKIIQSFENIKKDYTKLYGEKKYKFEWLNILKI